MNFETELKNGKFVVSECKKCNKIVWPSSEICNQCLDKTYWRDVNSNGEIIEFSKHDKEYFCLAKFEEEIRIMGKITSGTPEIGASVKITNCGIRDNNHYFEMSLL